MFTNSKYDNSCVWKSDDDKRGVVVTCMCGLWTNGWRGMLRRSITQSVTTPIPPQCWIYVFQKHLDIGIHIFEEKKSVNYLIVHFPTRFSWARASLWKYLSSSTKVTSWIRHRYSVGHHPHSPSMLNICVSETSWYSVHILKKKKVSIT